MDEPSRTAASPGHPELPTGNVTFLFTDIQGSTKLLQRLGADYATLLDRHNAIIERAIAAGGGAKVGSEGDSIFAAFPDTVRAIEAVAEAQRSLFREPWADGCVVRVRMGLHTGEGRLGAESYVGLDVHKAARISAAGHGGQVLLSAAAAEATRDHLPVGVTLVALGKHLLKDFDQPEDVYQLAASDLPSEFPPLRARRDNPLPTPMTALVGRDVDVESARELILRPGVRLVTITGPGGTGKTRLATELLHLVHPEFPDGVHYVDLSALSDPKLVLPALGRVLGILDAEGRDIAAAAAGLVARSRALVVLDNMEQVIDAAPDVVAVLEQTQDLKFLVTSREPLRVRGEFEYPLNPLSVPDRDTPTDELPHIPAVDLFVQRAQAVNPGFVLSDDNARTVAGIVARLDGLPLAIELAAPKLRGLSPQGLLERLEGRLDLLKGGARDLPDRHQTLWAAISWGYDLLDEDSKGLFRRLGVFAGGWTLEAVRVVGGPATTRIDSSTSSATSSPNLS